MNPEHNLFVYRPLLPESSAQLKRVQKEYASVESFAPVKSLHVTILAARMNSKLSNHRVHEIINDAPKVSQESFDAEIINTQLDSRSRDITRLAIKLMLQGEAGDHYFQEHEEFLDAVKKADEFALVRKFTQPHITLGYLDAGHGVASVMDRVDMLTGTMLGLGPTESNLGTVFVQSAVTRRRHKRKQRWAAFRTPVDTDEPVRTIQPGSLPEGLLASLRPHDLNAE